MGFTDEEAEATIKISSYESEQMYMMLENLMGGKMSPGFFVAPPGRTNMGWFDTTSEFRRLLLKYFCVMEAAQLWQLHGIGSNSHDAFNEIYARVKRDLRKGIGDIALEFYKTGEVKQALLADGTDLAKLGLRNIPPFTRIPQQFSCRGMMRDDHPSFISLIIQVQNAGHFIPRSFHPFFLKFMADNSLYDMDELISGILCSTEEELLNYTDNRKYHFRDAQHFVNELNYLFEQYMNVPLESITQGTGATIERGSFMLPDGSYPLQLVMVCAAHKQLATLRALQLPSNWSTSSVLLHLAKNALLVATEETLGMVHDTATMETFIQFEAQNPQASKYSDDRVEAKWKKTPPGREITSILEGGTEDRGGIGKGSAVGSADGGRIVINPQKDIFIQTMKQLRLIHDLDIELIPPVEKGKILWHVIPIDLVPHAVRSEFVGIINSINRDYPDLKEKIKVVNDKQDLGSIVAGLIADPGNIVDVAVGDVQDLEILPDGVKALVFKGELGDFRHLEGILAALRALHNNNIDGLLKLYEILTGEKFDESMAGDIVSKINDPKQLAEIIVFTLKPVEVYEIEYIRELNKQLLQFIYAA